MSDNKTLEINDKSKEILFITSTRIGDAVLSTGILNMLLKTNPNAQITVACGPVAAPLFAAMPRLKKVIVMKKKKFSKHWFELWGQVVKTKWDVVVDLRRSLISYMVFCKKRYILEKSKNDVHRVVENARILGLENNPPKPKLWIAGEHIRGASKRMKVDGVPILGICPCANWAGKTWDAQNFVELIKRITAQDGFLPNAYVAVFGVEKERHIAKPVLDSIPENRRIDLVGGVGLLSAYACLEKCSFFVGNDSGLMHMSAASNTLTLGLFGPSRDELYSPWGDKTAFVRTKEDYKNIFPENYDHRTCGSLMGGLSVDMADDAAWDLWNKFHRLPRRKK